MNSAPPLDLAGVLPALPQEGEAAATLPNELPADAPPPDFSLLLAGQQPALPEEAEADVTIGPEIKKTEEESDTDLPDEVPWMLAPLVWVRPPPEFKLITPEAEIKVEAPQASEVESPNSAPVLVAESDLPQGTFETAVPEAATKEAPAANTPKPLEISRPLPQTKDAGMVVAQQVTEVKNRVKTAEITPVIEQKMPVREFSRRILPETSRNESFQLPIDFLPPTPGEFEAAAPSLITPARSLDAAHAVETIRAEAAQLRQWGDSTVSIVLKPENSAPLQVEVSVASDGSIHAHARCEASDFDALSSQWTQLQQSLATHGIRMTDLSPQNHFNQQSSSSAFENFGRGENQQQQQRQDQSAPTFEEELADTRQRFAPQKQTFNPTTAAASRRWQSWA